MKGETRARGCWGGARLEPDQRMQQLIVAGRAGRGWDEGGERMG